MKRELVIVQIWLLFNIYIHEITKSNRTIIHERKISSGDGLKFEACILGGLEYKIGTKAQSIGKYAHRTWPLYCIVHCTEGCPLYCVLYSI